MRRLLTDVVRTTRNGSLPIASAGLWHLRHPLNHARLYSSDEVKPHHINLDSLTKLKKMLEEHNHTSPGAHTDIRRILVLYNGGTIGMKIVKNALAPVKDLVKELKSSPLFHDTESARKHNISPESNTLILPEFPGSKKIIYCIAEYDPLLDSSNLNEHDWARMAIDIEAYYKDFDGFIILHGTDTLAYSASALSFMLENLGKPVILTGSQLPIFELRTDGRDNFLGALFVAANYTIPEVCVFFNQQLFRGNRCTKIANDTFHAFESPNLPPLVSLGTDVKVEWSNVLRPSAIERFRVEKRLCPHVALLRIFPCISPETIKAFLRPPLRGIVLETYGTGNVPMRPEILECFTQATQDGIVILNTSQCIKGCVKPSYETGAVLLECGVIPGADLTPEAALTKMAHVLGKEELTYEEHCKLLSTNIRGEMRVLTEGDEDFLSSPQTRLTSGTVRSVSSRIELLEKVAELLKLNTSDELNLLKAVLIPQLVNELIKKNDLHQLKNLVIQTGFNLAIVDSDGRSALHTACREGHPEMVKYLLEQGALIHQIDRFGNSPLNYSTRSRKTECINLLVRCGATLTVPPMQLGSELTNAAANNDLKALEAYVLAGANVNQKNYEGSTALHLAVVYKHMDAINFLLKNGADPQIRNNHEENCFDLATRVKSKAIRELLRKKIVAS